MKAGCDFCAVAISRRRVVSGARRERVDVAGASERALRPRIVPLIQCRHESASAMSELVGPESIQCARRVGLHLEITPSVRDAHTPQF